jgi:hypothetical protein
MWVLLRRKTITNGVCDNVQVPVNTLVRRRYHFCLGCVRPIIIKGTKKQKLDIILQPKNSKLQGSSQKRVWPKIRFFGLKFSNVSSKRYRANNHAISPKTLSYQDLLMKVSGLI